MTGNGRKGFWIAVDNLFNSFFLRSQEVCVEYSLLIGVKRVFLSGLKSIVPYIRLNFIEA